MGTPVTESGSSKQISASTLCVTGSGQMLGIFVSSASSSPTITVYDNTAASGTKLADTFTPSPGYWPIPFGFGTGLYVAIGGTVSCTVGWA